LPLLTVANNINNDKMISPHLVHVTTELPVLVADLTPIQANLDIARLAIAELQVSHPQSPNSNVKATYMSPWGSHFINPKLMPLVDVVTRIGKEFSGTLSADLAALNMDLVVTDCWGIIYDRSSFTALHNHFPAEFACSVYLEAHPDSSPIVIAGKLNIKPKPGMMVMFPGILNHEVPATSGRRVVVAMNLNKRALFERI
jgi:hypothetical protein